MLSSNQRDLLELVFFKRLAGSGVIVHSIEFPDNKLSTFINNKTSDKSDVYLVSYPRSGNTWMRYMLAYLLHPDMCWNLTNLNRAVPDLHQKIPGDYILSYPRIFKSHSPYCVDYPKVIYLYRDGRDVSLSYYDLQSKVKGYQGNYSGFLRDMLQGKLPFGSWQEHADSWLSNRGNIPLLAIQYEHLFENTVELMINIGEFLDIQWSESQINWAMSMSTYEKQKKDFFTHKYESHWSKGFQAGIKGGPGKWRESFNEQLNELFWQYASQTCEKLSYPKN